MSRHYPAPSSTGRPWVGGRALDSTRWGSLVFRSAQPRGGSEAHDGDEDGAASPDDAERYRQGTERRSWQGTSDVYLANST
jgi:hypothetical protein